MTKLSISLRDRRIALQGQLSSKGKKGKEKKETKLFRPKAKVKREKDFRKVLSILNVEK